MFQLYLLLRLKNFGRIVIELGIFRIVFLTILTVAAIMILFLAENRFAIPVVCVLLTKEVMNIYEYSANLSGSISYSFFLQPQEPYTEI